MSRAVHTPSQNQNENAYRVAEEENQRIYIGLSKLGDDQLPNNRQHSQTVSTAVGTATTVTTATTTATTDENNQCHRFSPLNININSEKDYSGLNHIPEYTKLPETTLLQKIAPQNQ